MSREHADRIAAYEALDPSSKAVVRAVSITHVPPGDWTVRIETVSASDSQALVLTLTGARDLKIDWPSWSVVSIGPLRFDDVSRHGLEGLNYRFEDPEGLISLWCRDFDARLE